MDEVIFTARSNTRSIDGNILGKLQSSVDSDDVSIGMTSRVAIIKESAATEILEHGVTSIFNASKLLKESIIKAGSAGGTTDALDIARLYMDSLDTAQSLSIIDPYFFTTNPTLFSDFCRVAGGCLQKINDLQIIHLPNKTSELAAFSSNLAVSYSHIKFSTASASDIHDRFWISDKARALVIGISLNGIGKKFCLIEEIEALDVQDIILEMKSLGVIIS